MSSDHDRLLSKVPEVTLGFWIIKVLATTLGETGGDSVTMTLNWGYLTGTAIFFSLLIVLVIAQIAARRFYPLLYWATIVALTTAGTTMAFRRPLAWHWLYRWLVTASGLRAGRARSLVLVGRYDLSRDRQYAEGRTLLLGDDHAFACRGISRGAKGSSPDDRGRGSFRGDAAVAKLE